MSEELLKKREEVLRELERPLGEKRKKAVETLKIS